MIDRSFLQAVVDQFEVNFEVDDQLTVAVSGGTHTKPHLTVRSASGVSYWVVPGDWVRSPWLWVLWGDPPNATAAELTSAEHPRPVLVGVDDPATVAAAIRSLLERQPLLAQTGHAPVPPARELGSTYYRPTDRFVVSLIVSYDPAREPDVTSPAGAAAAALALTRDAGARGTHWHVFDRAVGQVHVLEQRCFDDGEGLD